MRRPRKSGRPPPAPPAETGTWRDRLLTKPVRNRETGETSYVVLAVAANVATILRYHPAWHGVIVHNAFRESMITISAPPWHPVDAPETVAIGEWTDADTARLCNWLARVERLLVGPKTVEQALAVVAHVNVIHPVREYLHGLVWDGVPRLDTMLPVYFGTDDTPYERGVGSRWCISCVARIEEPGCQVDCTMILEGDQGIGKTSAFRALVPDPSWYADSGIDPSNKDSFDALRGVWIYGLDELDSLKRGDLTRWKNFLTATRDHFRESYGHRTRDFVRQTAFCGTTNESQYLTDRTGNRRFLPVKVVRQIDVAGIRRDRDQLWAEALHRYRAGEAWHVNTPEFRALCEEQQTERVTDDAWETFVGRWLDDPKEIETVVDGDGKPRVSVSPYDASEGVLTSDVLVYALGMRRGDISMAHTTRVAAVLRALGYEPGKQRREDGQRVRRYRKLSQAHPVTQPVTGACDT